MTTEPIDPSATLGNPLVRLRQEGSKWIASTRHGDSWASNERASAATAVLAGLNSVGVKLDDRSARILRALETFEKIERLPPGERPYGYDKAGYTTNDMGNSITSLILWLTYASDEAVLWQYKKIGQDSYVEVVENAIREEAIARGLMP